jgi:hypothetical protein
MLSLLPVGWHEQQRQPSPVAATAFSPTPPPTGASSGRWLQPCRCAPPTFTSACASMRPPPSVGGVAWPVCRLYCSWADAPPGTHAQPHCSRAARARSGAFGGRPPPRAAPRAARAQASGMRRRLLGADAGAGAGIVGGEDSHAVAESTAATRRRTTIRGSFTLHVRQRPTSSQPPLPRSLLFLPAAVLSLTPRLATPRRHRCVARPGSTPGVLLCWRSASDLGSAGCWTFPAVFGWS